MESETRTWSALTNKTKSDKCWFKSITLVKLKNKDIDIYKFKIILFKGSTYSFNFATIEGSTNSRILTTFATVTISFQSHTVRIDISYKLAINFRLVQAVNISITNIIPDLLPVQLKRIAMLCILPVPNSMAFFIS